jgi:hypothetical protein
MTVYSRTFSHMGTGLIANLTFQYTVRKRSHGDLYSHINEGLRFFEGVYELADILVIHFTSTVAYISER